MYVVFLKYIFVENFNTSSRSHQPIPWNCNAKILGAEGPRADKNKYPERRVKLNNRASFHCKIFIVFADNIGLINY